MEGYNFDKESSQLIVIPDNYEHPMDMFENWLNEAEKYDKLGWTKLMNIATLHGSNGVLNRNVIMRRFDRSGFVFVTEKNSRKFKDLKENSSLAATFFWKYMLDDGKVVLRQVRINGTASEVSPDEISELYAEEGLSTRIRCKTNVCGRPCDIDELKKAHDEVLENYKNGTETLPRNESYIALLIKPKNMDFYDSRPSCVGDRLLYNQDNDGNWSHHHIYA